MWEFTEGHVEALASGAELIGSGGGGELWLPVQLLLSALRKHGPVTVLDAADLPPGAHAVPITGWGSSAVFHEKPPRGGELVKAVREVELQSGTTADATMPWQIGGIPATVAVLAAAELGVPIVDADTVGRATYGYSTTTLALSGLDPTPLVMTNDRGATFAMDGLRLDVVDEVAFTAIPALRGWALSVSRPLSRQELLTTTLPGSLTRAVELGRMLRAGRRQEMAERYGARILFHGKVTEVKWRIFHGRSTGTVVIEHAEQRDRVMRVEMRSEFLAALEDGRPVACAPDVISLLEHETGAPLNNEHVRYGLWVEVLGIPSHPKWRTEQGLALFGPRAFGYDFDYTEMGEQAQ